MKGREGLEAYIRDFVAKDRLGALLGARFISLSAKECRYEYEPTPEHYNPNGILHGGVLFSIMDTSQGLFVHSFLEEDYRAAATGTATIRYLAPVRSGKISIRTWMTRREGRKLFIASEARDGNGRQVAALDEVWIAIKEDRDG